MDRRGLGALLLRHPANFAWYTNGADNRVDHASASEVASVLVTHEAEYILANNIEASRMREEQTVSFEVAEYPWHEDPAATIRELTGGTPVGSDSPPENAPDVSDEIIPLRYTLDPDALERYRQVGADATAVVAEAADTLKPGMSEHEAAANLAACWRRGLFTPVLLAAADGRTTSYRHPIPYGNPLERRAMLVMSAERRVSTPTLPG